MRASASVRQPSANLFRLFRFHCCALAVAFQCPSPGSVNPQRYQLWPTVGLYTFVEVKRDYILGHFKLNCHFPQRRDSYEKHRREQVKNIFASIKEILEKDFECKGLNSRKEIVTQCTLILRTYSDSSDPKQNWARQRADGTPGLNLMVRTADYEQQQLCPFSTSFRPQTEFM
jgi:hypothetical protein